MSVTNSPQIGVLHGSESSNWTRNWTHGISSRVKRVAAQDKKEMTHWMKMSNVDHAWCRTGNGIDVIVVPCAATATWGLQMELETMSWSEKHSLAQTQAWTGSRHPLLGFCPPFFLIKLLFVFTLGFVYCKASAWKFGFLRCNIFFLFFWWMKDNFSCLS